MSHIFISYAREDLAFASKIVTALAEDNLDTWVDWKSIPKGEEWWEHIQNGIEEADAFLFLVSPDSVISSICTKEIGHALVNGKRILPIVTRDTEDALIPEEISKINWIFCREGQDDFSCALEDIHQTIHTDHEWLKYHTELQVKALRWNKAKDSSRLLRGKELSEAIQRLAEVNSQTDPLPTSLQREYVTASERLTKVRGAGFTALVATLLGAAALAIIGGVILFDRTPAEVKVEGQVFEIRNRFNWRFLEEDVGSTIAVRSVWSFSSSSLWSSSTWDCSPATTLAVVASGASTWRRWLWWTSMDSANDRGDDSRRRLSMIRAKRTAI